MRAAFFLNLAFTLIEIAGGFWTNSVAILTDALHDGGDCASLGLAWYQESAVAAAASRVGMTRWLVRRRSSTALRNVFIR